MSRLRIESVLMLTLLSSTLLAFAVKAAAATGVDSPTTAGPGVSVCYFFRLRLSRDSLLKIPVYIDGAKALEMVNGRWTSIEVPNGHHVIRSNDNQYGVELDLRPGETYYFEVRFGERTRFHGVHQVITSTPSEQAAYEIKQLKPLDSTHVFWTINRPLKP